MSNTQNKFENLEILIDKYVSEHKGTATLKEHLLSAIEDEKFLSAVEFSVKAGKTGTGFIQRKLKLGYARASYMIDAMEALGLITAPDKMHPRKVFPEAEEFLTYNSK